MFNFWQVFFLNPIEFTLFFLNGLFNNLGLAIIILTIVIQILLTPLRLPALRSAKKMARLKPHLEALKEKHKEDKVALARAQMNLYKEHGISLWGGTLPTLLSIPIVIALYQVLAQSLQQKDIPLSFFWLNLSQPDPFYILPALVAVFQWFQSKQMLSEQINLSQTKPKEKGKDSPEDAFVNVQKQMQFIFPLLSAFIVLGLPSGVGLYWLSSLIFSVIQQKVLNRFI